MMNIKLKQFSQQIYKKCMDYANPVFICSLSAQKETSFHRIFLLSTFRIVSSGNPRRAA